VRPVEAFQVAAALQGTGAARRFERFVPDRASTVSARLMVQPNVPCAPLVSVVGDELYSHPDGVNGDDVAVNVAPSVTDRPLPPPPPVPVANPEPPTILAVVLDPVAMQCSVVIAAGMVKANHPPLEDMY
jgi:hypothetical protein